MIKKFFILKKKSKFSQRINIESIKKAFTKIKAELEDHLDSINENTMEIQSNYHYICELENKIEKLGEKLDEILMLLGRGKVPRVIKSIKLSLREQEIFILLYTKHNKILSFKDISKKLGLKNVEEILKSMSKKGIALIIKQTKDENYVMLDPNFKNLQTRYNIVEIDKNVMEEFVAES